MRKNKRSRKAIKRTCFIYSRYEITGLNLERLISRSVKKGIPLYNIKRLKPNKMRLSINFNDTEKFFANLNELCYNEKNVKKIRDGGLGTPINFLVKNVGVLIGSIIFFTSAFFFDNVIFDTHFEGTGAIYEREILDALDEFGVKKYSKFSNVDLRAVEDSVLSKIDKVSFLSLKKQGKTLIVYSVKSLPEKEVLTGTARQLISNFDGVIEKIKVYRGTAKKCVGDKIAKGEVIVDGFVERNGEIKEINVIASATISSIKTLHFILDKDDLFTEAETLFVEKMNGLFVTDVKVTNTPFNGKYLYTVTATVKNVVFTG